MTICGSRYIYPRAEPAPRAGFEPPPIDSLLDQLPDTAVSVRGVALPEVLRPAYLALGR